MRENSINKQEQFLWLVQTIILSNAMGLRSGPEELRTFQDATTVVGLSHAAAEALLASERIPFELTASEAAIEFCSFVLENLRPAGSRCPRWFARS